MAAWLPFAIAAAQMLGKGAQKSAEGRRSEARDDAGLAAVNNRGMVDFADHNLSVDKYNLQAPSLLAKRGIGASGLMNYQAGGSHPGGQGFAASLQDPAVRDAILGRLVDDSGNQLKTGSYKAKRLGAPQQAKRAKAGWLEKIGGVAGFIGNLGGAAQQTGMIGGGGGASSPDFRVGNVPNVRF